VKLLLKDIVFTVLVPGTTVVLLPRLVVGARAARAPLAWGGVEGVRGA